MHLDAVLVLVSLLVHPLEMSGGLQLGVDLLVNLEVVQRRTTELGRRQGTTRQADMVGGSQNEDALPKNKVNKHSNQLKFYASFRKSCTYTTAGLICRYAQAPQAPQ